MLSLEGSKEGLRISTILLYITNYNFINIQQKYLMVTFLDKLNIILEDKDLDVRIVEPVKYEPLSDEQVSVHFNDHHMGYVNKLIKLVKNTDYAAMGLEEIIKTSFGKDTDIFNNAAQVYNHNLYWESMSNEETTPPEWVGRDEIISKSMDLFGSGWVWVCENRCNTGRTNIIRCNTVQSQRGRNTERTIGRLHYLSAGHIGINLRRRNGITCYFRCCNCCVG
ncbi:MAG: hypothetical protein GF411_01740 [Candidatus Lokiarchaeota archaeon]|nr:hypothetical protein [Candidatus Lokiarchaeota archaeon]